MFAVLLEISLPRSSQSVLPEVYAVAPLAQAVPVLGMFLTETDGANARHGGFLNATERRSKFVSSTLR